MSKPSYDLVVIGAGPGGSAAAIRASQLGLKTAIVERDRIGGTCLNRGCIPTKAMAHVAHLFRDLSDCGRFGIDVSPARIDFDSMKAYCERTISQLTQGLAQSLEAAGVALVEGEAKLLEDRTVRIERGDEGCELSAKNIILATGSIPSIPPIPGIDLPGVLTSDQFLAKRLRPQRLLMIGGGVIGVEIAELYAALGGSVTILEARPRLLPGMDRDIARSLQTVFKNRGIKIHPSALVESIEQRRGSLLCRYSIRGEEHIEEADTILCAVGRKPNTEGLFEGVHPEMLDNGTLAINETSQTSLPGIYAIGDLTAGSQLAHRAQAQGIAVAEAIAGNAHTDPMPKNDAVPSCVYTDPEIAAVGITEEEAKTLSLPIVISKRSIFSNPRSVITQSERGIVKLIANAESGQLLGAHIMAPHAAEMIGGSSAAIANHLTVSQLTRTIYPHPTFSETLGEAIKDIAGKIN